MRGLAAGMVGLQKVGGLLGVHGDGMIGSSSSEIDAHGAGRIVTPHHEYPIFTPGFREPVLGEPSRSSFQDADGQGIWKEIHPDTPSTDILELAATSRYQRPDYAEAQAAVRMSPSLSSSAGVAMTTTGSSNYYIPSTPTHPDYMPPNRMHGSPATGKNKVPHSPHNVNILSPQLRPLEKSPKRTQLHMAGPRVTENGGLTPMVNQLTLSSNGSGGTPRPSNVELQQHNMMLPPAQSPHMAGVQSPMMSSSTKLKKMMKLEPSRSSVSKDRSPGRTWKSSFRGAVSPAMGMTRDTSGSCSGRGATGAAQVAPSWRGACGDGGGPAMSVAPILDQDICPDFSGEMDRSDVLHRSRKTASTPKSGSYNILNFRSWGKKKHNINNTNTNTTSTSAAGGTVPMKHSTPKSSFLESDDLASAKADSESIKVLDYTIKTLRYKLDQVNQKRNTAVEEARAFQSALEASDEKCRQLAQRCRELEFKLRSRGSGLWDMELEDHRNSTSNSNSNNINNTAAAYIVGRRDPTPNPLSDPGTSPTPEQFLKVFEDSVTSLRKLASSICHHIRDNGESATQVITTLLEQHRVGRAITRMPRNIIILYFESFLNQVMFESFENVSFEPNGASSVFCPETLKQHSYQLFQSLKSQEWASIEKSLSKPGALVVSPSFHRFFVGRMELILSQLGKLAENEISLTLMAAIFDAVKAVWLVHHMAFAFDQPASIFRVSPAADFDARFMEQVTAFEAELQLGPQAKISIMLNPGFIVNRQIIKCQVYSSVKYD